MQLERIRFKNSRLFGDYYDKSWYIRTDHGTDYGEIKLVRGTEYDGQHIFEPAVTIDYYSPEEMMEIIGFIRKLKNNGICSCCNNTGIDIENNYDSSMLGFISYCNCNIGKDRQAKEIKKTK